MGRKIWNWIVYFFTGEQQLNVTLFKILGTGGAAVSIFGTLQGVITGLAVSEHWQTFLQL